MKKPYKSEREFIIANMEFERGMISAWNHIIALASSCVRAHEKNVNKKYQTKLAKTNAHLIEKTTPPRRRRQQENRM